MQIKLKQFKAWAPTAQVIVGGPHPSSLPEQTLNENPEVDFLCKGEGERTFESFLDYLTGRQPIIFCNGLYYKKDGIVFSNPPRDLIPSKEMDQYEVDWPTIMANGHYQSKLVYRTEIVPALPVITTRGCPYKCTFCDEANIWLHKVRKRSISSVVREITMLKENYGVTDFNILDDTFTLSKKRVAEFCEYISPLNIRFRVTAKVNTINQAMVLQLEKAGCQVVAFGVESGDQNILDIMKKKQTIAQVKYAFSLMKESKMLSYALCMVGNLGETMTSVRKTLKLVEAIEPDFFSCGIMTPYPGSENYSICKKNGWIKSFEWANWNPSVLKIKDFKLVSRTDTMDEKELLEAYYLLNRYVVLSRFKRKYGILFFINLRFFSQEIFPRLRTIGIKSFINHLTRLVRA